MKSLLTIQKLKKSYDGKNFVLKDVNINIKQGEFIAVIGSSGAGKSTLMRCINRLIEPSSGKIIFDGVEVTTLRRKPLRNIRSKIGMIFQHFNLINSSTVLSNVLHGTLGGISIFKSLLGLYTQEQRLLAVSLLKAVGLENHKYKKAGSLSGGQMQRVGICRALMQNPRLLLADEPIASLDPVSAKSVMDHLKKITVERGLTCLVNLHQVEFAKGYATRIIGLKDGQIVFDGRAADLTDEMIAYIYGDQDEVQLADKSDLNEGEGIPLSDEAPFKKIVKVIAILAVVMLSFTYLDVSVVDIFSSFPNLASFFSNNFLPPNFNNFQLHLSVVLDMVFFAIVGTVISGILALFFGLLMSKEMNPILPIRLVVTFVVSFFRNVPLLIWATLAVYIFGIGPLVGVLALVFATLGFLARSYAESMNEIAGSKLEALRAVGASYLQILFHGLLPEFMAAWINWTLFAFEINIRASGILGMVGAGGLGLLIQTRLDFRQFRGAFALILTLTVMVLLTEFLMKFLRRLVERQKYVTALPWQQMLIRLLTVLGVIAIFLVSVNMLNLDFPRFLSRLENAPHVLSHFLALNLDGLSEIVYQLFISIAVGIAGLAIGCAISFILAFMAAENVTFSKTVSLIIKSFISIIRAIPSLVLILMIVASLGFGYTSAVVGLVFSSMGYLTKAFIATIEEQDPAIIETLKATGASKLQIMAHGLWPNVKNSFISWISIRLESNIADSISLGIVGAGGVGMLLSRAIRQHHFSQISTIILIIFGVMLLLEFGTSCLKRRLNIG